MNPRIYVACLASYNNGALHGAWIDATQSPDDMQAEIDTMLRASKFPNVQVDCRACLGVALPPDRTNAEGKCPTCHGRGKVPSAEEYAIHDYDNFGSLASTLGEYPDLDKVSEIANALETHGDAYVAYVDWRGADYASPEDFEQCYRGQYDNVTQYAEEFVRDMGLLDNVPETVKNYFDYESFSRDMVVGGDIAEIDSPHGGGVFIFDNH